VVSRPLVSRIEVNTFWLDTGKPDSVERSAFECLGIREPPVSENVALRPANPGQGRAIVCGGLTIVIRLTVGASYLQKGG